MKKFLLYTILAFCFTLSAGCRNKNRIIIADDIQNNTVLVKNDGTVQTATVELFDKDYYNMDELENFITEQINKYNQAGGEDSVVMESLKIKKGNAVLVLNYSTLENYMDFNDVEAAFTTVANAKDSDMDLPEVYVSASDGAYTSPDVALKNDKYKVLVLHDKTDVIVDGSVKYFTNATLVSKSKLQTGSKDQSVIIYKP